jgi:hypothetical protein
LAPLRRASLSPIAIACLRLLTVRPDPLLSVPFFLRCIADFTLRDAADFRFAIPGTSTGIVVRSDVAVNLFQRDQRWQVAQ